MKPQLPLKRVMLNNGECFLIDFNENMHKMDLLSSRKIEIQIDNHSSYEYIDGMKDMSWRWSKILNEIMKGFHIVSTYLNSFQCTNILRIEIPNDMRMLSDKSKKMVCSVITQEIQMNPKKYLYIPNDHENIKVQRIAFSKNILIQCMSQRKIWK